MKVQWQIKGKLIKTLIPVRSYLILLRSVPPHPPLLTRITSYSAILLGLLRPTVSLSSSPLSTLVSVSLLHPCAFSNVSPNIQYTIYNGKEREEVYECICILLKNDGNSRSEILVHVFASEWTGCIHSIWMRREEIRRKEREANLSVTWGNVCLTNGTFAFFFSE
jgi:hypothetical protein